MKKSSLDRLKNKLRGSSNPIATLSEIRPSTNYSDFIGLLDWLPNFQRDGKGIFQWQYPRRITDLRRQGVLRPIDSEREIIWARHWLSRQARKISLFLKMKTDFEYELTNGDYAKCQAHINNIERELGLSIWAIENRIAILQLTEGIEKQKAYTAQIRDSRPRTDVLSYIAYRISHRNEETTTIAHFTEQVSSALDSSGTKPDVKAYVLLRAANRMPNSGDEVATLLRVEQNSSIIDYYETFIKLATWAIISEADKVKSRFYSELSRLSFEIADARIAKLLFMCDDRKEWLDGLPTSTLAIHDLFLAGRFHDVAKALELESHPGLNPAMWFMEATARAEASLPPRPDDKRLSTAIVNLARTVLLTEADVDNSIVKLAKVALNFRLLSFASTIEAFISEQLTSQPFMSGSTFRKMAFIESAELIPEAYACLITDKQRAAFSDHLLAASGPHASLDLEMARYGTPLPGRALDRISTRTTRNLLLEMEAERSINLGLYEEALANAQLLDKSNSKIVRTRALRFIAFALIKLDRIGELAELIVDNCIRDKDLAIRLPIRECAQRLDKQTRKSLSHSLAIPILLDLYSRHISDNMDSLKSFAYEDFLLAHGLERPSQLTDRLSQYPHEQLVHYLRHLCVPAVMQRSCAFNSTRELEDERLKVLAILASIDQANVNQYSAEIRDITRNQKIQRGVRQVEQSKISIDVMALRRWAEINLKESFARYKAFLQAGIKGDSGEVKDLLGDALADKPAQNEIPEVPKNEAIDLLFKMLSSLFRECTLNPEHGLDCYLSIRIRHGTLSGQLRSPLEKEEIISQRESNSPEYKSNIYWLKQLSHLESSVRDSIDHRLIQFSKDYDKFIDRIANELIQIRTVEKKSGLFKIVDDSGGRTHIFGMGLPKFAELIISIKEKTSFHSFLDQCLELFWGSVEQSLKSVRSLIDSSLKDEITLLFTTLEKDIADIAGTASTSDLDRAIRTAKTGAQEALDRVKEWFHLSKPLKSPELDFQDVVDIGLRIVRTMHPDFDPIVELSIPESPIVTQGGLEKFTDIFIIIFDNIRIHSGLGKKPKVEIELVSLENKVKFYVRNNISSSVRTPETEAKVQRIKQFILEGAYQSAVRSEGGSGLFKLRKVIGGEQGRTLLLDFGFSPNDQFFVEFELPSRYPKDANT